MISAHFDREEFACKCGCGFDTVDHELLVAIEDLREWADLPITILSGCRCEAHNKYVGGATHSQHKRGRAADMMVLGRTPKQVAHYLHKKYPHKFGIGEYLMFTHLDSRADKARWKS